MKKFKQTWEIQHNWQLIFPFLGVFGLGYSAFRLSYAFFKDLSLPFIIAISAVIFYVLLKITLFCFKKLENRWIVTYKWEMIRIFIVFALTGTSSMYVSRPIIKLLGITKENLNLVVYWVLYIIIGLIFYQILLISFGWLFGQFKFFWEFEKKMLRNMGFKRFLKK